MGPRIGSRTYAATVGICLCFGPGPEKKKKKNKSRCKRGAGVHTAQTWCNAFVQSVGVLVQLALMKIQLQSLCCFLLGMKSANRFERQPNDVRDDRYGGVKCDGDLAKQPCVFLLKKKKGREDVHVPSNTTSSELNF